MLETLRALSHGPALQQPIIFLFNGAEESLMQVTNFRNKFYVFRALMDLLLSTNGQLISSIL